MQLFTDVLRQIRKGVVVDQLTSRLGAVVAAVREHGKAGTITLKLTVKPAKGDGDQVVIESAISHALPEKALPDAIFYVDGEGGLVRNDPSQREMFSDTGKPAAVATAG